MAKFEKIIGYESLSEDEQRANEKEVKDFFTKCKRQNRRNVDNFRPPVDPFLSHLKSNRQKGKVKDARLKKQKQKQHFRDARRTLKEKRVRPKKANPNDVRIKSLLNDPDAYNELTTEHDEALAEEELFRNQKRNWNETHAEYVKRVKREERIKVLRRLVPKRICPICNGKKINTNQWIVLNYIDRQNTGFDCICKSCWMKHKNKTVSREDVLDEIVPDRKCPLCQRFNYKSRQWIVQKETKTCICKSCWMSKGK